MYNGQTGRAGLLMGSYLLLEATMHTSGIVRYFGGLILLLLLEIGLRLAGTIEAVVMARRLAAYTLQPINRWYWYLATVIIWFLGVGFLGSLGWPGIQTFSIVTPSSAPLYR